MRQGDFGELNRVIYDPNTNQPFANNVIPQARWDPAARNIMEQLYPAPNVAGTRGATGQEINNYLINPSIERQDNQMDVKVDHNLTQSNRFFTRYSYQKTHRVLPATLPHGDAGFTFGAGDGNIKAQSLAFNDTQTLGSSWLNEFRFGWSSIKFLMTPIDYGTNIAQQVGIPGINLNDVTSAMSQIQFPQGGIRNLGANGNQPLITNQNDFQIFNNVTWLKGSHTLKAGGSVTLRSREILNADTIVGQFQFSSNQTSNCAGITSGCTLNSSTGFDVASFLLGLGLQKNRNLFDSNTYTEKRPEYALYLQDDFRATNKLTLNLGLRWDVFPPWIEIDDRQSNFDPSTGRFVVASPDAVIDGVKVGRYLQTYSKRDRSAPRLRLRRARRRADDHPRRLRHVLELHAGRHVFVEGAEPAVPAVDGADHDVRHEPAAVGRAAAASGRRPEPGAGRIDAVDLRHQLPRRLFAELELQRPAAVRHELHGRSRLRRLARAEHAAEGRPESGAGDGGRHRPEHQPAVRADLSRVARPRPGGERGDTRLSRPADEVPAAVRRQRLGAASSTWSKAIDLNSDNDGNVTLLNRTIPATTAGRRTTTSRTRSARA